MSLERGEFSGRLYDSENTGIPIERRSIAAVKIIASGIEIVARHVSRFGRDEANELMIERLRRIADGLLEAASYDFHFYTHELREYERYVALGYPAGQPLTLDEAYELWNNAHTATLEEYGVRNDRLELYHPDAQAIMRQRGDL